MQSFYEYTAEIIQSAEKFMIFGFILCVLYELCG